MHMTENLAQQIAQVKQRLAEARARVPKHSIPAALVAEIDELDEELERLTALANADPLALKISELEQRLAEANARIPQHDVPAALIAEIDDLEEELVRLRAQRKTS
jgi:uncharacterized coiled-coil DUF342 family protein